ncbi:MAG: serine/threonine-protein kinase, partial [Ignavibacteriaceae bacterium]
MINGRYIVRKKIGEGRSKVFHVIDTEFPEREVAAKFLDPTSSEEEKQKFRDEFFTLQRLDHPGIIKSFDLSLVLVKDNDDEEIENNSPFITMEYFSATEILNYQNLKDEKQLNFIIKQICSVLYYLHQSNYIYYDLKAENILVTEDKNYPKVKLIDLGFATYNAGKLENNIKGTPQYIAPELLKNEQHNHTVDYYSLGILLYRIIFGKYPFKTDNELDIYKSQIENEFIFSESVYSKKLISVVSRLLKKNPSERFENAIEILKELNISIDIELVKDFIPAKVISARNDALNIINTYLKDKKSNEVFTITGFDGSGKSALLQEIYFRNKNSIFIENTRTKTGLDSIKYIFRKIILNELIHLEKQPEYSQIIEDLFNSSSVKIIETVKRIFNTLRSDIELILLFDDYNLYDNFTIETLTELIRIFQIKGLKVILTESSDFDYLSSKLNNLCEIQLNQFTDHQLSEFLDLSYYQPFPKRELKKYILLYSDLLPGNIKQFIKDLILLKVLKFDDSIVSFSSTEDIVLALQSSHEEIYRMRLSNLNSLELKLSQIISAFDISVEQTVLSALLDVSSSNLKTLLNELEKKNIIESLNLSNAPSINSFNFKRYIYSTISNRIRFHLILANSIKKLFPDFNTVELSRQYDLANEPEKAVEVLEKEIDKAEEVNAYSYKKELLEKSLKNFLPEKTTLRLTAELVKTLYKLSDYKLVLENLYKLKLERFSEPELHNLRFIKGSSLIELGNTKDGIDMLINLMSEKINKELSNRITVALALAEFDLNRFSESEEYCKILLRDSSLSLEEQGKANNLMAMIEVRSRNNVNKSLEYSLEALKEYELAKLPSRVAGMH